MTVKVENDHITSCSNNLIWLINGVNGLRPSDPEDNNSLKPWWNKNKSDQSFHTTRHPDNLHKTNRCASIKDIKTNQAHPLLRRRIQHVHNPKYSSEGETVPESNIVQETSSTTFRVLTFDMSQFWKRRREEEVLPGWKQSRPQAQETDRSAGRQVDGRTDRKPETDGTCGLMGSAFVSLNNLKVVQDGHDVLRHEDVAGVNRHAGHGDEEGVWRGDVKDERLKEEIYWHFCS